MPVTVVLAEDEVLLREGLVGLLSRFDFTVLAAVVLLSQFVQAEYAAALLESGDDRRVGYLLKDRVADVAEFAGTLRTVVGGGTAIDPR
ncbi:hypothetical protein Adu01nite_15100 [Paractinoplanes durhamensis]|uniref:Uncharacterized protein n=1 Tax=Paractinoplanes durhamensis TaxID=113563 RepID=A0ABQ3YRL2_9ACTN|nr:hypothetical protein Adu01nite_15100 [Actinoplanes durhamensis]